MSPEFFQDKIYILATTACKASGQMVNSADLLFSLEAVPSSVSACQAANGIVNWF
jgi:hypothetical protein